MDNGCLTSYGRLQDVKEGNADLFAVWQQAVRQARLGRSSNYCFTSNNLGRSVRTLQCYKDNDVVQR